jgi:alkylation response protein AidB-like acyl-CoA dehydrogenase
VPLVTDVSSPSAAGRDAEHRRLDLSRTGVTAWERLSPWPELEAVRLDALRAALDAPDVAASLLEAEATGTYPHVAVEALRQAGLGRVLAHDEGAPDDTTLPLLAALNVLTSRRCGSLGITVGVNSLALLPVHLAGDAALLRRVGERVRDGAFSSMLLTELSNGSNLLRNQVTAERGVFDEVSGFVAVPDDAPCTHYRLEGEKDLINGATEHALLVTLARTRASSAGESALQRLSHFTMFVIERDATTVPMPRWATLPMRGADIAGLRFEGTVVPASAIVGREGGGFKVVRRTLTVSRGGISALAAGTTARAAELARTYARRRDVYGGPIMTLGPIAEHLMRVEALERVVACLSIHGAAAVNAHGVGAAAATAGAKVAACALAEEAVREGARLLGGRALLDELPYARLTRDVLLYAVFDGTSHVVLDELAAILDGEAYRRARGEAPAQDPLAMLRATYGAAPAPLVARLRAPSASWTLPLPEALAALAALPGEQPLGGLAGAADALLALVARLRDDGRWQLDSGLRFLAAELYAELEGLTASAALADPDRRGALGLAASGGAPALDRLAWRFAAGWLGGRLIERVRGLAARAELDEGWLPASVVARGGLDGCARDVLHGHGEVRRALHEALRAG